MEKRKYSFMPLPAYCYIFRRWLDEDGDGGQQSGVVCVTSDDPLYPDVLLEKLSEIVSSPKSYVMVEMPRNSIMHLDTWEPLIEGSYPIGGDDFKEFTGWWSFAELKCVSESSEMPAVENA